MEGYFAQTSWNSMNPCRLWKEKQALFYNKECEVREGGAMFLDEEGNINVDRLRGKIPVDSFMHINRLLLKSLVK
jgi:hypothetical protein